jgi:hypothetical protein
VAQGVCCRDALRVVKLEHFVEQVKCLFVVDFANLKPGDSFFLHLVGDEHAVAVLKGDLFDCV